MPAEAADMPTPMPVPGAVERPEPLEPGRSRPWRSRRNRGGRPLHPWPVRTMHWVNAAAMLAMIGSGWGIYNDSVIFHFIHFPVWAKLGSWAGKSLQWHFAAMWVVMLNGAAALTYGLLTGRLRRRLLPITVAGLLKTLKDTLHLKLAHDDLSEYNAIQKLLYLVVIAAVASQVVTGMAIWKPVQLSFVITAMGGFQNARLFHFLGMAVIVGFLVVHVLLSFAVPQTLWAMLFGGPRVDPVKEQHA